MKIGFIVTGIMGAPMVGRQLEGGHKVTVYNRKLILHGLVEKGAASEGSEPGPVERGKTPNGLSPYGYCTGALQQCRRPGRQWPGPFGHGPHAREAGRIHSQWIGILEICEGAEEAGKENRASHAKSLIFRYRRRHLTTSRRLQN